MLSYISLAECIKTCPYEYDPELSYDELDVVLIENTNEVYQCKPWPENLYCNQFPPVVNLERVAVALASRVRADRVHPVQAMVHGVSIHVNHLHHPPRVNLGKVDVV